MSHLQNLSVPSSYKHELSPSDCIILSQGLQKFRWMQSSFAYAFHPSPVPLRTATCASLLSLMSQVIQCTIPTLNYETRPIVSFISNETGQAFRINILTTGHANWRPVWNNCVYCDAWKLKLFRNAQVQCSWRCTHRAPKNKNLLIKTLSLRSRTRRFHLIIRARIHLNLTLITIAERQIIYKKKSFSHERAKQDVDDKSEDSREAFNFQQGWIISTRVALAIRRFLAKPLATNMRIDVVGKFLEFQFKSRQIAR